MADADEYRCFIGGLSWSTTDDGLKDAFGKFGRVTETKVVVDKFTGKSKGFGFVTFEAKQAMEDAIEEMHGISIDGRSITVDKAQPQNSSRDRDGGRDYDRDRERGGRGSGDGRGSGGGECFKCGKPGHFARECHSDDGSRGGRYGGRDDKYGGRDDKYGGGGGRYDSDRSRDRSGGRSRDGGSGSDRYNRDRSGPYDRRSSGSRRD